MSKIEIGTLPPHWRAQTDASLLLTSLSTANLLGTAVSGVTCGAGRNSVAMHDGLRRRPAAAPMVALGTEPFGEPTNNQTHIEKQYVTTVNAVGVDASGPPRKREPA
ncbi:MAG TPA: hypothetical protein VF070_08790 [Streptosporangiaceae bacterium]